MSTLCDFMPGMEDIIKDIKTKKCQYCGDEFPLSMMKTGQLLRDGSSYIIGTCRKCDAKNAKDKALIIASLGLGGAIDKRGFSNPVKAFVSKHFIHLRFSISGSFSPQNLHKLFISIFRFVNRKSFWKSAT